MALDNQAIRNLDYFPSKEINTLGPIRVKEPNNNILGFRSSYHVQSSVSVK